MFASFACVLSPYFRSETRASLRFLLLDLPASCFSVFFGMCVVILTHIFRQQINRKGSRRLLHVYINALSLFRCSRYPCIGVGLNIWSMSNLCAEFKPEYQACVCLSLCVCATRILLCEFRSYILFHQWVFLLYIKWQWLMNQSVHFFPTNQIKIKSKSEL